tara:strand:- start:184 stop:525 length:342 start_codon:yes stop_codon:yes gene_type:complete
MDYETGRLNHIEDVLVRLHTGNWFGWSGTNVYANLEIYAVDGVTHDKPSEASLIQGLSDAQAAFDAAAYSRNRAVEYPSIGDQFDMQYHDAVNSTTTWRDAIAAVKTKYAKPS